MKEALKALCEKIAEHKHETQTEEATKTAFVLPFIALLGYDVFNPKEVKPEFIADLGTKKGEKVDYALLKDGEPVLIVECKHWEEDLEAHKSQLHRYFGVTHSRFALLTNGIKYYFFSDLEADNKMDQRPFLEIDLENLRDNSAQELSKFHKSKFDIDLIVDAAGNMKYTKAIREILEKEFTEPSEDFTRFFARLVYSGKVTAKLVDQFSPIIKKAISQHINDIINDRLKAALSKEADEQQEQYEATQEEMPKIITTDEEIDALNVVRAILCRTFNLDRITGRDTQSYYSVLLDNTNRQPICRFHFNRKRKYLGVFNENKEETRIAIEQPADIYQYSEKLLITAQYYESASTTG